MSFPVGLTERGCTLQKYTNNTGLSLFAQVFLATDHYDHSEAGLSATTLLKPIKQVILAQRVPMELRVSDVMDMEASRAGTAMHDGFERAWISPRLPETLASLGMPPSMVAKVRVNPSKEEVEAGGIFPVYLEQRLSKQVHGLTVTGKFDNVINGEVGDLKNTSVWKYMNGDFEAYVLQGSIYRWLDPSLITKDIMNVDFRFGDWKRGELAQYGDKYPPNKMITKRLRLLSYEETDAYVNQRVSELIRLKDVSEEEMPPCTDKELWRKPTQYRYYKDKEKAYTPGARSTNNFDNAADAYGKLAKDGNVGVVIEKRGEVTACKYCSAFLACQQKDALIAAGDLVV